LGYDNNQKVVIRAQQRQRPRSCLYRGAQRLRSKGGYRRQARHLDCFGVISQLLVQMHRYRCVECGRSFIPSLPGLLPLASIDRALAPDDLKPPSGYRYFFAGPDNGPPQWNWHASVERKAFGSVAFLRRTLMGICVLYRRDPYPFTGHFVDSPRKLICRSGIAR
jgi:hypothetical protein